MFKIRGIHLAHTLPRAEAAAIPWAAGQPAPRLSRLLLEAQVLLALWRGAVVRPRAWSPIVIEACSRIGIWICVSYGKDSEITMMYAQAANVGVEVWVPRTLDSKGDGLDQATCLPAW